MTTDNDEQVTLDGLRAEVVRVRDEVGAELRAAVEERDATRAELETTRAQVTSTAEQLASANAEIERLKTEAARVPGGTSERQTIDTSSLSPGEKIRAGLAERRS